MRDCVLQSILTCSRSFALGVFAFSVLVFLKGPPARIPTAPAANNDVSGFGGPGRLNIFVANFGQAIARNSALEQQVLHLNTNPGHILIMQEAAEDLWDILNCGGWVLTPKDPWIGGMQRGRETPQLLVGGWPTLVAGVEALEDISGSYEPAEHPLQEPTSQTVAPAMQMKDPPSQRCFWLFASCAFKREAAGLQQLTVCNVHLHSKLMARPNSQHTHNVFDLIAEGIRSSGARILAGDANKGLFFTELLLEQRGITCTLAARHCGLDITARFNPALREQVAGAMLHDTMGLWVLGPRAKIRHLSLNSRCVISALHPALMEMKNDKLVSLSRGLESTSFPKCEVTAPAGRPLGQNDLEAVPGVMSTIVRIWDGHKRIQLDKTKDIWAMQWETLLANPRL